MSGLFDDIDKAQISTGGPKLNPGHNYALEILSCELKNGFYGQTFIMETVVQASDDPALPPGTRPSWTANMKHSPTKGNILCLIASACGIDPKAEEERMRAEVKPAVAVHVVSPANPLRGRCVLAAASETETKAGFDMLVVKWSPCKEQYRSRANDAPVAGVAAVAPTPSAALPSMPGAFVPGAPSAALSGLFGNGAAGVPNASLPALSAAPAMPGLPGASASPPPIPGMSPPPIPGLGGPPPIPTFPPAGWQPYVPPNGYFWKGNEAVLEAELRARMAQGRA